MNPVLEKHVRDAEREFGIRFDLTDFDALRECAILADAVRGSSGAGAPIQPCIEIGGVMFYRMSIGAADWFAQVVEWFDGQDRMHLLCLAYALAGARTPVESLWPFRDSRDRLVAQLRKFKAHLGCPWDELAKRIGDFLEQEHRKPMPGDEHGEAPDRVESGFGPLLDLLLSEYGGTPEQWLWHTPRATIMDLIREIPARQRAKNGSTKTDPDDPRVIAGHRLVERLRAMAEAKKAKVTA